MSSRGRNNSSLSQNNIKSKVEKIEVVHHGDWLDTQSITYTDPLGNQRKWEAVDYANTPKREGAVSSVEVIAILYRNLRHNCIVLVKQFRPPMGCYTIELPAGLCDEKDADVEATALRELYEETGYVGEIEGSNNVYQSTSLEPSTQSSTIATVHVSINGDLAKNFNCVQHLDDGEFVEVILIPVRHLLERLNGLVSDSADKIVIDSRLYTMALGLQMGLVMNTFNKPIAD